MDLALFAVGVVATAADPLLIVMAIGAAYALRRKPVGVGLVAGILIALILEMLVVALAAADRDFYRFGQNLLPRVIAAVALTLGAQAMWRAFTKPAPDTPPDPPP